MILLQLGIEREEWTLTGGRGEGGLIESQIGTIDHVGLLAMLSSLFF